MNIENNASAYQMMKKLMIETENRIRSAYNYGFKDGVEQGRAEALSENKRTDKHTETHACDCISRQEILKGYQSVCEGIACHECRAKDVDGACRLESFINNIPSADRPTGRWHIEPGIGCFCSKCSFDIGNDLDFMEYVHYCPNCGARMESDTE